MELSDRDPGLEDRPALFIEADNRMRICRGGDFRPVVAVIRVKDLEKAAEYGDFPSMMRLARISRNGHNLSEHEEIMNLPC
jgi:hypothetical protein